MIQRLIWPSPLVRERAASGIARLLNFSSKREQILERLLNWIKKQNLESIVPIGLLPLLKAAEKKDGTLNYISLDKVVDILPITSIVIEKLIEELSRLLNRSTNLPIKRKAIDETPATYSPSEFFEKYITGFLAPIYLDHAKEIDSRTRRGFIKQWSYTSEEIMRESDLKETLGDAMDFMGGHHSPVLLGMSTVLSEVYRSAFIRVLQYFYDQNLIPEDFYLEYAYATLPVGLSYWKVKPSRAPKWWPKLQYSKPADSENRELYKISFQRGIDQAINSKDEFMILGLDGAVEPAEGWIKRTLDTSITLIAFGYKVVGPNIPEAKKVARKILYSPSIIMIPTKATLPLNFLESYVDHLPTLDQPIKVDDLILYPLVARNRDLVIDLWQWFRDYHASFALYSKLGEGLYIKVENCQWTYMKDARRVANSVNWLEGLKERHEKDYAIPQGNYIEVDSSFIRSYLDENGLRLGYISKTTYKYKKYSYDKAESIENYELIGVGRIIV
ncbi:MAG: hypothetical protein H8D67_25855 [Deltaproteobacteria bacterium]|nr:hypothetical protein [Deltaproteobacteria bacterium]